MKTAKINLFSIIKGLVIILLALIFIMPFVLVLSVSVSDNETLLKYGYTFFPKTINFSVYKAIFSNSQQLVQSYKITILYSLLASVLSVIIQSMIAYSLSRRTYKYCKFLTVYLFITMLFSGGLIPSYILNSQYLHLNNTFWVYIFPGLVSTWNIIIIRTFFQGLPEGLVEASKIDGASEFRIYAQIIMPLSKPVLATICFMTLLSKWNDWNTCLIYIRNSNLYSLQYLLQRILREAEYLKSIANTSSGLLLTDIEAPTDVMKFAMAVLAAGPMMVAFPFFQKYFTRGLTVGSIKG